MGAISFDLVRSAVAPTSGSADRRDFADLFPAEVSSIRHLQHVAILLRIAVGVDRRIVRQGVSLPDPSGFLLPTAVAAQVSSRKAAVSDFELRANRVDADGLAPWFKVDIEGGRDNNDTISSGLMPCDPLQCQWADQAGQDFFGVPLSDSAQAGWLFAPEPDSRHSLPDGMIRHQPASITNEKRTQDDASHKLPSWTHRETDKPRIRSLDRDGAVEVEHG